MKPDPSERSVWNGRALVVAMAIALMAPVAFGDIYYEFQQSSHSDSQSSTSTLNGRAVIAGVQSRVDFIGGDAYPPGTYCISRDGSRTMYFVDPLNKSYTEVNMASVAAGLASKGIVISNLKSSVVKLEDHPVYGGYPTEHYRLSLSYDIAATMKSIPVKQSVTTEIDKWTTVQFGDVAEGFLANGGLHTGNPDIDRLIDLETTKVKGFILHQTVRITTTAPAVPGSELKFHPVRTVSSDFTVTKINETTPDASTFAIPATFTRVDTTQIKAPQTQVEILSMEPSGNGERSQ
jgi:hypothetical protein